MPRTSEEIARRQAKAKMEGEPEFGVERGEENTQDSYSQADNQL